MINSRYTSPIAKGVAVTISTTVRVAASGIQACHSLRSEECQPGPRNCSANITPGTGNQ